jgi:hypothetical protein
MTRPTEQPASAHHVAVGEIVVTTLLDAYAPFAADAITGLPGEDVLRLHAASRRPWPMRMTVNAFLVRAGERFALIDTAWDRTRTRLPDGCQTPLTACGRRSESNARGTSAGNAPLLPGATALARESESGAWARGPRAQGVARRLDAAPRADNSVHPSPRGEVVP